MSDDTAISFLAQFKEEGSSINGAAASLGMDPGQAQDLAMDLVAQGLLNIVSLSGKMSLTDEGLAMLGSGPSPSGEDSLASLVEDLEAAGNLSLSGASASDFSADLACLKAQLKRSQSLAPVIDACLEAIAKALGNSAAPQAKSLAERALSLID